ncbi:MAG TPA: hypothetical protein DCS15_01805 [Flavobacteriales bacterium]|nr:hypothetical protein [Flavobacteriales bacterium]
MRLNYLFLICLFFANQSFAQHTFSIVAVDTLTAEIGSAGATCGDSIVWPGSKGAYVISEVIPGVGGIHAQALLDNRNKANARNEMLANKSPQQIIDWLIINDISGTPEVRQYGIVDYNAGSPRSASFTGDSCMDYKNHITGYYYSIQGNILLGQGILDSMEARFLRSSGCMGDRLMQALQGANVAGADSRCLSEGTSSLSAFVRIAKPDDSANDLFLDINVAGTGNGIEPIDVLQSRFDNWKLQNPSVCANAPSSIPFSKAAPLQLKKHKDILELNFTSAGEYSLRILNLNAQIVFESSDLKQNNRIELSQLSTGLYSIQVFDGSSLLHVQKMNF